MQGEYSKLEKLNAKKKLQHHELVDELNQLQYDENQNVKEDDAFQLENMEK